jgi:hypothetical protein
LGPLFLLQLRKSRNYIDPPARVRAKAGVKLGRKPKLTGHQKREAIAAATAAASLCARLPAAQRLTQRDFTSGNPQSSLGAGKAPIQQLDPAFPPSNRKTHLARAYILNDKVRPKPGSLAAGAGYLRGPCLTDGNAIVRF